MSSIRELLHEVLVSRLPAAGAAWLQRALAESAAPASKTRLLGHYTAAAREAGKRALELSPSEEQQLAGAAPEVRFDRWAADDAARALLLMSVSDRVEDGYDAFVLDCYEQGDSREQQSWLRGLSLVPACERFAASAIDACRTNILPLFESIACENPYPARHFPELNFNQMVLKALFNGVALARVAGLESRLNDDLARMADDYVSEREAAGRDVPRDIWLALAPRANPEALPRVYRYLRHEDAEHRYWAAAALGARGDPASVEELQRQRSVERDARVAGALDASLEKLALPTKRA